MLACAFLDQKKFETTKHRFCHANYVKKSKFIVLTMLNLKRGIRNVWGYTTIRSCYSTSAPEVKPGEIFRLVGQGDLNGAAKLCEGFAQSVNMSTTEFLSKQCSERSYLIYRLSTESRAAALQLAQLGEGFPDGVKATELVSRADLWHDDVAEQYHRALNCLKLSRCSLKLGSPHPARDYQIIGKSLVYKLLFGRTACVLQTFMSRKLQEIKNPYEWALTNHRNAARLFDEVLAPQGPVGPLEKPDDRSHDQDEFKDWCEKREMAATQHLRLIAHLASDVARHVLHREEAKAFIEAADEILAQEMDNDKQIDYMRGVFRSTLKAL